MRIQPLSSKKVRKIIKYLDKLGIGVDAEDLSGKLLELDELQHKIILVEAGDREGYIVDNDPPFPFLGTTGFFRFKYWVNVDEGAARAVLRGADLMAPGIKNFTEFPEEAIVLVKLDDSELAIGKAIVDSNTLSKMERGKAIKILHYKGDKIWKALISRVAK